MKQIYRTKALNHISNPDQLDQSLRLIRARHLAGYAFVVAVVAAALVWSILETAPVQVNGSGILLSSTGVKTLTTTGTGRIEEILVAVGDTVVADQPIARLSVPERWDALERAQSQAQEDALLHEALEAEFSEQNRQAADLAEDMKQAMTSRITNLEALRSALTARRDGEAKLNKDGVVSGVQLYGTESQLADTNNELASVQNKIVEFELQQKQQRDQRAQELARQRIQAKMSQLAAKTLENQYDRERFVRSKNEGVIAQLNVDINDQVQLGQAIARLISKEDDAARSPLTAFVYIHASEGKKVQVGMDALISPSIVKPELDGYVRGTVSSVSPLPGNRASLMRILGNEVLIEQLLKDGAPIAIQVALTKDAETPSGYAWTSGLGPDVQLHAGTLANAKIAVDRIHLISLLLPAMEYVYGWIENR